MDKRWLLIPAGLISAVLVACSSSPFPSPTKPASAAQPAEKAATPAAATEEFIASGPIIVENQVDVASEREGVVAQVIADPGASVRKGQVLGRLDDRQLLAQRDAARAKAASVEADWKNWEAQQKVDETDLQRAEGMWTAGLITQQQLDHARYRVTQSEFESEREHRNYESSLASVRALDLELAKTAIVAPFDGVVARRYVRVGQRVAVGDRLFWVTAVAPMRVRFTLSERYLGTVERGTQLQVIPAYSPEEKHTARVIWVSPVVDPSSGTLEVLAELSGAQSGLRPGMAVNIRLQP